MSNERELIGCEFCDTLFDLDSDDGCPTCHAEMKRQQTYYSALFAGQHRYTETELRSCYSEPCERAKLERMLETL